MNRKHLNLLLGFSEVDKTKSMDYKKKKKKNVFILISPFYGNNYQPK